MNLLEKVVIFLGNMSPLFAVITVIYYGQTILFELLLSLTVLTGFFNLYWRRILSFSNSGQNQKNYRELEIKDANDLGNLVLSYFLTYTLSLPAVAVIGGIKGLIVLSILLAVVYVVMNSSRIMLYNPFLTFANYKIYRIETTRNAVGYLIVKKIGGVDYKLEGKVEAIQIDDYIYLQQQLHKSVSG